MTLSLHQVLADGAWLAHRHDAKLDTIQFIKLTREGHDRATFITDQHIGTDNPLQVFPRRDAARVAAPISAPLHFILHSAFCCSTLLARAFDQPGLSTALKEPVLLNDVVGFRRRGASGRDVAELLDHSLTLLARPFERGEAVVVKPSNVINGLSKVALTMRPAARAVLLHAPLRLFITSVAKKGLEGRLWVRDLVAGYRKDGLIERFGIDGEQLFGQTDLQIAAIGWLAQQAIFADLIRDFGPTRVLSLDSEAMLDAPADTLARLATHFGIDLDFQTAAAIAASSIFSRDAKSGKSFGRSQRDDEYREAGNAHGDEIDKVIAWATVIAEQSGVPLTLGARLLA